ARIGGSPISGRQRRRRDSLGPSFIGTMRHRHQNPIDHWQLGQTVELQPVPRAGLDAHGFEFAETRLTASQCIDDMPALSRKLGDFATNIAAPHDEPTFFYQWKSLPCKDKLPDAQPSVAPMADAPESAARWALPLT